MIHSFHPLLYKFINSLLNFDHRNAQQEQEDEEEEEEEEVEENQQEEEKN